MQKAIFYTLKGHLLEAKRRPFAKTLIINGLSSDGQQPFRHSPCRLQMAMLLLEKTVRNAYVEERYGRTVLLHYRFYFRLSLFVFHLDAFSILLVQAAFHYHRHTDMCRQVEMPVDDVLIMYLRLKHRVAIVADGWAPSSVVCR